MGDIEWVITCLYPAQLHLLLAYLPEEPWPWLDKITVVTHRDMRCWDDLVRVVNAWEDRWPVELRDDSVERDLAAQGPPALRMFFEDSLGVKALSPLTHRAPMLFTDDDIVLTRDPSYLFETGTMLASYSGLDFYGEGGKDTAGLEAINHAFQMSIARDRFNRHGTDEAVWFLPRVDRDAYWQQLTRYFTHPHVVGVAQDRGTAPHGHTQRFRKLGMRFFSGYNIWSGGIQLRSPNYRIMAQRIMPKSVPNATFIHYCASGLKPAYMEMLWTHLRSSTSSIAS